MCLCMLFFFSSRRRHTRCALVTGVQTCALPICLARIALGPYAQPFVSEALDEDYQGAPIGPDYAAGIAAHYFNERKLSIFAGSNEVQREIITKVSLEL